MSGERESRSRGERGRKPRPPLDEERLRELALRYVTRFATSRSKLSTYLRRKLKERGWSGDREPSVSHLVERLADLGYVNDAAFAVAKAGSLSARGYGERRVRQALAAAGIAEEDSVEARTAVETQAAEAALRFARRKRIGPFAAERPDQAGREKALAAIVRAGHSFALARTLVDAAPGQEITPDQLFENRS